MEDVNNQSPYNPQNPVNPTQDSTNPYPNNMQYSNPPLYNNPPMYNNPQQYASPLQGKQLSGWAKFFGIYTIIMGAISCLGIITAAIGVPMIFAGIRITKAVDSTKAFAETNDQYKLAEAIDHLNRYFFIVGIIAIVGLAIFVLYLMFIPMIIASVTSSLPRGAYPY